MWHATTQTESDPLFTLFSLLLPPSQSSTTRTTEDLWRNWGVAAEIFQNGGMNLLHPGTQEAHIHMHFYLRPITATQKADISKVLQFILKSDKWECYLTSPIWFSEHFQAIFLCGSPLNAQIWGPFKRVNIQKLLVMMEPNLCLPFAQNLL